jgi:hypothetical protein
VTIHDAERAATLVSCTHCGHAIEIQIRPGRIEIAHCRPVPGIVRSHIRHCHGRTIRLQVMPLRYFDMTGGDHEWEAEWP